MLLVLSFPTGRLASQRCRLAAGSILLGVAGIALGNAFTPKLVDYPNLSNPVGLAAFTGSMLESGGVGWFLLLAGAAAAGIGLVIRLRRARGVERQQLKWIAYAAGIHASNWIFLALDLPGTAGDLAKYGVIAPLLLIPLAAGVALLRFQLYDIDLVIRRTLLYSALVGILGGLYVGLVVGLQALLAPLTGGDVLPVALSTLTIGALFGPVRARIRAVVDRRFYRASYDAQQIVGAFGGRLRGEVEVEAVGRALLDATARAIRPSAAGVWVRDGGPSARLRPAGRPLTPWPPRDPACVAATTRTPAPPGRAGP